ncbi:MAG TPA: TonB-dependent receptor, partial [Terriglobales bacterium]|nr:TonB-dependent receptor [Terriglobales bacterium]
VLARYPLPNYPQGAYGAHTYATSAKVQTDADQFSLRLDHKLSDKSLFFFRVNFDDLTGPTTNPDQTVLDPSFGVRYIDEQRNVAASYSRTVSPRFSFKTIFNIIRTTPTFSTPNHTDPALKFNDGLFEAFNAPAGSVQTAFGNLFQLTQTFAYTVGNHAWRFGGEARLNRDTTYFGTSPNGEYDFGGGIAYSPVNIRSQSGTHDIHVGDPLPDTLSSLLAGSPFAYNVGVAPPYFSNGEHIGPAAINRNAFAMYFQDTWKISDRLVLDYGLRYELYSPISERAKRTSSFKMTQTASGTKQAFAVNPQPGYEFRLNGFGPRVQLDWRMTENLHAHIGGALTTIPPNIWQDNFLTGSTPFVVYPRLIAAPGAPIRYGFQITPAELPRVYSISGEDIFASGNTKLVPANTIMDVNRYQQDLASLSPSHRITPLDLFAISQNFGNGYLETWTAGLERRFGNITADANYIGTAGVKLPRITFPNGYQGASPAFAPYTQFDTAGNVIGGFGVEQVVADSAHSTYHALQTSLNGTFGHGGPGVQASYTWSKSLDDTSTVVGGGPGAGSVTLPQPQNPFDTQPEKAPSTFDVAHAFTLSVAQDLHLESVGFLSPVSRKITKGWELLSISSINSGLPFTIYSGVQQTGAGSNGTDRPDLIETPQLSTARSVREDYFGRGENNASFFLIPIHVPGGTGPNQGRFGILGRNTFRGPAFYNYDFALIKDTPFGTRASGSEVIDLQFRAEFFNLFNIVNMGLPANVLKGSGFGMISKTANNSRQIQFSLKVIY